MILRPALIARVREGQPSVLVRSGSVEEPYRLERRYPIERLRDATADDPPEIRERGRTREAVGHLIVTEQTRTTLGRIDDTLAKRAGFKSRHLFIEAWTEQHGNSADDREVWLITIELDRAHRPRYLSRPIAGKQGDYTTNHRRAIDDVEVVDQHTVEEFAKEARKRGEIMRGEQAMRERARSLGRRVRSEALLAPRAGIDIDPELEAIEQQLEAIQRKRGQAA